MVRPGPVSPALLRKIQQGLICLLKRQETGIATVVGKAADNSAFLELIIPDFNDITYPATGSFVYG